MDEAYTRFRLKGSDGIVYEFEDILRYGSRGLGTLLALGRKPPTPTLGNYLFSVRDTWLRHAKGLITGRAFRSKLQRLAVGDDEWQVVFNTLLDGASAVVMVPLLGSKSIGFDSPTQELDYLKKHVDPRTLDGYQALHALAYGRLETAAKHGSVGFRQEITTLAQRSNALQKTLFVVPTNRDIRLWQPSLNTLRDLVGSALDKSAEWCEQNAWFEEIGWEMDRILIFQIDEQGEIVWKKFLPPQVFSPYGVDTLFKTILEEDNSTTMH